MNISEFCQNIFKISALKYLLLIIFVAGSTMAFTFNTIAQPLQCTTVDNFDHTTALSTPAVISGMNPGPIDIIDNGAPSVLGTFRNITFGPFTGNPIVVTSDIRIRDDSVFSASNDTLAKAPVSIIYSANNSGLNVDFTNTQLLLFDLRSNDNMGLMATFVLTDGSNNSASFFIPNLPNNDEPDPGVPSQVEIPINEFENIENLDLTSIQSIEMSFDPTDFSADYSFTQLQFCETVVRDVPTLSEWGLIAMAGVLGLVGFIVMRRRTASAGF